MWREVCVLCRSVLSTRHSGQWTMLRPAEATIYNGIEGDAQHVKMVILQVVSSSMPVLVMHSSTWILHKKRLSLAHLPSLYIALGSVYTNVVTCAIWWQRCLGIPCLSSTPCMCKNWNIVHLLTFSHSRVDCASLSCCCCHLCKGLVQKNKLVRCMAIPLKTGDLASVHTQQRQHCSLYIHSAAAEPSQLRCVNSSCRQWLWRCWSRPGNRRWHTDDVVVYTVKSATSQSAEWLIDPDLLAWRCWKLTGVMTISATSGLARTCTCTQCSLQVCTTGHLRHFKAFLDKATGPATFDVQDLAHHHECLIAMRRTPMLTWIDVYALLDKSHWVG